MQDCNIIYKKNTKMRKYQQSISFNQTHLSCIVVKIKSQSSVSSVQNEEPRNPDNHPSSGY